MSSSLPYSTALITGASSGFGEAIALRLAKAGLKLILVARRQDRLGLLADRLAAYTQCHVLSCDISHSDELEAAIQTLPEAFKYVDILINNAGLALGVEPAHHAEWKDWQQMIATNCTALAHLTHLLIPNMVARNCGHILNMGSTAGYYAYKGANVYGATKAFVEQFSQNLKSDLIGTSVRVTHIAPGMSGGSEFSLVRYKGNIEKAQDVYAGTQALQPEDVAEAVYWAIHQPAHVNICTIELMPVCQALGGFSIARTQS